MAAASSSSLGTGDEVRRPGRAATAALARATQVAAFEGMRVHGSLPFSVDVAKSVDPTIPGALAVE